MHTEKPPFIVNISEADALNYFLTHENDRLITLEKAIGTYWYKEFLHRGYMTECYVAGSSNYYKLTAKAKRILLETENTEFNYGHNTTYKSEEL